MNTLYFAKGKSRTSVVLPVEDVNPDSDCLPLRASAVEAVSRFTGKPTVFVENRRFTVHWSRKSDGVRELRILVRVAPPEHQPAKPKRQRKAKR